MAEQVLSWILDKGASILSDDKDQDKSDILLKAIKDGDFNIVTMLIGVVTDMNKMKFEGESLLSIAAFSGQTRIVKLLVSKGADIEGTNDDGLTPLHVACREGHLEIVRFLVSQGGDINRQTSDGMTPLAMAAKRGHDKVLRYLISKGVEIERMDEKGWSPLIWACVRGLLSTANYLIQVGADINGADKDGWTSLHFSIYYDRLDVVKSLVSAKADLNWPDEDGTTPLHVACYNGRIQILKHLLSNGADLHKAEFDGTTLLHSACAEGHHKVVSFIVQQKEGRVLINRPNSNGETPLHVATSKGFTSIIETLISYKGDINAQTNKGHTCLHLAARLCDGSTSVEVTKELSKLMGQSSKESIGPAEALMKLLIMKGADVNMTDKSAKVPLHYLSDKMKRLVVGQQDDKSVGPVTWKAQRNSQSSSNDDGDRKGSEVASITSCVEGTQGGRRPSAISEQDLHRMSEDIPNDKVQTLGLLLGFTQAQTSRFGLTNVKGTAVTSAGTREMLFQWYSRTKNEDKIPALKKALPAAGLVSLAEKYLMSSYAKPTIDPSVAIKPMRDVEEESQSDNEMRIIWLDEHNIKVHIPRYESHIMKEITVEALQNAPPELVLNEDEAIISVGLKFSPPGLQFSLPIKITMPHSAIFTNPEKANIFFCTRRNDADSYSAIPSSECATPRCVVRQRDLDLYIDHFSEWWIIAYIRSVFYGKRLICTPYVPVSRPRNRKHCIYLCLTDDNNGPKENIEGHDAAFPGTQYFLKWGSGKLSIKHFLDEQQVSSKSVEEREFYRLTNHRIPFLLKPGDSSPDVMVKFSLSQDITKDIMFPVTFDGQAHASSQSREYSNLVKASDWSNVTGNVMIGKQTYYIGHVRGDSISRDSDSDTTDEDEAGTRKNQPRQQLHFHGIDTTNLSGASVSMATVKENDDKRGTLPNIGITGADFAGSPLAKISDRLLLKLSQEIPNSYVRKLGIILGFSPAEINPYRFVGIS